MPDERGSQSSNAEQQAITLGTLFSEPKRSKPKRSEPKRSKPKRSKPKRRKG
jgi:hypothetical protein